MIWLTRSEYIAIGLLLLFILLTGCASTFARGYIDKPVTELKEDLGDPYDIVYVSETKKIYQYYWGGGSYTVPGYSTSFVTGSVINTITMPAETTHSPGCLISFVAVPPEGPGGWRNPDTNKPWVIVDAEWPSRMVC